jgi:hypothetical protein
MFMHAMKKNVITNRSVFTFGEILLGVEDRAVAFFANLRTTSPTKAIEAVTYGAKN